MSNMSILALEAIFVLSGISDIFEGLIDKILPSSIWPLVIQILATVMLVFIVYKLLYNPMKKFLAKRAEFVKNNIDGSLKSNQDATLALQTAQAALNESKVKAQASIQEATVDAQKAREALLMKAEDEARAIKLRAEDEIAESKRQALDDIHREIINVALEASKHVLAREINESDNARLVDDFIKEVKN